MKKILYICLIWLFACNVFAQTVLNVDSLVNVLETKKLTANEQMELYDKICNTYIYIDAEKHIIYAEKGLDLAEKKKSDFFISIFNEHIARSYYTKTSYDTCLIFLEKALSYAIKAKEKDIELRICITIGALYGHKSEYSTSLEYFLRALPLCEITDNKMQQIKTLGNIGGMFRILGNTDQAINYLEKAKTMAEDLDYPLGKMQIYYELGGLYEERRDIDKALDFFLKSAEISHAEDNKHFIIINNQTLAMIYCDYFNDYDAAMEYALENLQLIKETGSPERLSGIWVVISNIYLAQHNWKEGESAALKAWENDSISLDYAPNIAFNMIVSNIQMSNKERAVYFLQKYRDFKNQYNDDSFHQALTEMEVKYETEKKEIRIAALEEERKLYIYLGIAGAAILLLAIGLFFFRQRLSKQKIKQLEQEKQLIATQAVLDGESAERSRLARDLHDGLGGMLSVVKLNLKDMKHFGVMDGADIERFDKALDMLDQSIGELRRVAHHVMPESLMRYGLKVSLEDFCHAVPGAHFQYLGDDPRLDSRLEVLIYRCAYELVNNAVKHARATNINVQLMIDSGIVSLTVHDDGIGFDPQTVNMGIGLENIRTRIALYNGKMTIHSAPDTGTEISIEIE